MAETATEEPPDKTDTAASSPESTSGGVNGLKARKDRNCPFCGQAFTSSSLGRHLDLYIKPRNPKAPDGVHDVDEIRKIRGGITRRQPRTNVKGSSQREDDGARKDREAWTEPSSGLKASDAEPEQSPRDAPDGRVHTFFNAANWQATGVINNLPPRVPSRGSTHTPQPQAHAQRMQDVQREDTGQRMYLPDDGGSDVAKRTDTSETSRAAELALRELLGSLEAATKRNTDTPKLFDIADFFALAFPGLCLAMLPPPSAIFSSTPFSAAHTWSVSPPGEQQRAALSRALHERLTAVREGDADSVSDAAVFRYRVHLDGAYEHWQTLSEAERASAWTLELCRAFSKERERKKDLVQDLDKAQQRIRHLEAEYDRMSRCQLPREFLLHPPNTISISSAAASELRQTSLGSRAASVDYDAEALLRRWKAAAKATAKPPRPPPQARHVEKYRSDLKTDLYMTGSVFGIGGPIPRESDGSPDYLQAVSQPAQGQLAAGNSPRVVNVEEVEGSPRMPSGTEDISSPSSQAHPSAVIRFGDANLGAPAIGAVNANGKRPLDPSSANGRPSAPRIYKERPA